MAEQTSSEALEQLEPLRPSICTPRSFLDRAEAFVASYEKSPERIKPNLQHIADFTNQFVAETQSANEQLYTTDEELREWTRDIRIRLQKIIYGEAGEFVADHVVYVIAGERK